MAVSVASEYFGEPIPDLTGQACRRCPVHCFPLLMARRSKLAYTSPVSAPRLAFPPGLPTLQSPHRLRFNAWFRQQRPAITACFDAQTRRPPSAAPHIVVSSQRGFRERFGNL